MINTLDRTVRSIVIFRAVIKTAATISAKVGKKEKHQESHNVASLVIKLCSLTTNLSVVLLKSIDKAPWPSSSVTEFNISVCLFSMLLHCTSLSSTSSLCSISSTSVLLSPLWTLLLSQGSLLPQWEPVSSSLDNSLTFAGLSDKLIFSVLT